MPIAWTFGVGMQTAESKDRANLNLACFVLRFSEGGVGGVPSPLPPSQKKAASFISRLLFRFRANCLLDLELLLSLELYF
jgi:hypothetical protein